MSSPYNNNTHFVFNIMIWLGISLGISLTISLLLPFPMSLVVIIAVFVLLNFYMRRRLMQRTRTGARGRFSSVSSSFTVKESSSLKYSCMNCGTQHKDISCPNCGSKIKKVVYWWSVYLDVGSRKGKRLAWDVINVVLVFFQVMTWKRQFVENVYRKLNLSTQLLIMTKNVPNVVGTE
jgi:predicted RNA-binding Zn-ribbon protein involved in translation (DUF1610 family)